MSPLPKVTCVQLSYGRPHLSVEAVESFLRQTYENKLLLIINTHHSPVRFTKPYTNIKVYNTGSFPYLSDVYRFAISQVRTKYYFIWDDDDIFLPWHIADRVRVRLQSPACNAITHEVAFTSYENKIKSLDSNMFVSQYLYDNNGILPDPGIACWDVNWDRKPWKRGYLSLPRSLPSYIYRWATGESHISGAATEKGQHQNYLRNIEEKKKVHFPDPWVPCWRRDYAKDALSFMKDHKVTYPR